MNFDIAHQPATARQRRTVALLCLAVPLAAALAWPWATQRLTPLPHIAGIYGASAAMIDLATAWLLMSTHAPSRPLRIIAAAYLFAGLMAVLYVLSFPGALLMDEPVLGTSNSASWLFVSWRAGFPLFILWAVGLEIRGGGAAPDNGRGPSPALVATLAVLGCLAAALAARDLPALVPGPRGLQFTVLNSAVTYVGVCMSVVTLTLMLRRGLAARALYLWLMLVLVSETVGVLFSTSGGVRFTLAWYGARIEGVSASAIVLVLLATHFRELQRRLGTSVVELSQRTDALQAEIQHRERAERMLAQSQKLDAVGQLAAGLAHDINNFMQVVSLRAELIKRRLGAGVQADVEVIQRNVRKAEHLTRQLLLFAGRRPLSPQTVRLQRDIPAFMETFQSVLAGKARVQLALADDVWPVAVDATELEIALANLLTNARDAVAPGGLVRIAARNVAASADAGDAVLIEVSDDGQGMPDAVRERVFEPFFTTKEPGKGTGLGLSQVYAFARASGGDVAIHSEEGRGTTVAVRLPRHAGAHDEDAALAAPQPACTGAVALLVDDNGDVLESTSSLLQQAGFAVRSAASGAAALALLDGGLKPDVLLSDIVLGEMDGVTLARRVRERLPAVRVVLATGYSSAATEARSHGFTVLQKPYDAAQMLHAVSH